MNTFTMEIEGPDVSGMEIMKIFGQETFREVYILRSKEGKFFVSFFERENHGPFDEKTEALEHAIACLIEFVKDSDKCLAQIAELLESR